jgi:hypothetical protein
MCQISAYKMSEYDVLCKVVLCIRTPAQSPENKEVCAFEEVD